MNQTLTPLGTLPLSLPIKLTLGKGNYQYEQGEYLDISQIFNARTSDDNDTLPTQLQDTDGTNHNLANAAVSFILEDAQGGRVAVPNSAVIRDAVNGMVDIKFPFGVFKQPGLYTVYIVVNDATSQLSTIDLRLNVTDGHVYLAKDFEPLSDAFNQYMLKLTGNPDFKAWMELVNATGAKQAATDQLAQSALDQIKAGGLMTAQQVTDAITDAIGTLKSQLLDTLTPKFKVYGPNDITMAPNVKLISNSSAEITVTEFSGFYEVTISGAVYFTQKITGWAMTKVLTMPDVIPTNSVTAHTGSIAVENGVTTQPFIGADGSLYITPYGDLNLSPNDPTGTGRMIINMAYKVKK